jgi:hypothetical protein
MPSHIFKPCAAPDLSAKQLIIVLMAFIISRIQCAIKAWGSFIHVEWKRVADVILPRA